MEYSCFTLLVSTVQQNESAICVCIYICICMCVCIYIYMYIPSFFNFLSIQITTDHWVQFPVLHSRFSLVIYFIHSVNTVYISIPISILSIPSFPLCVHMFDLYVCVSMSTLQIVSCIPFFLIPHICINMYVFLFLTYFTLYDSL